mmetsp:Transcript_55812/g.146806  ORF Transcript_55812/g.146806 Transcript_55812/m.146806 type:complete len:479 (+) Transcript_55812:368-1804(+)
MAPHGPAVGQVLDDLDLLAPLQRQRPLRGGQRPAQDRRLEGGQGNEARHSVGLRQQARQLPHRRLRVHDPRRELRRAEGRVGPLHVRDARAEELAEPHVAVLAAAHAEHAVPREGEGVDGPEVPAALVAFRVVGAVHVELRQAVVRHAQAQRHRVELVVGAGADERHVSGVLAAADQAVAPGTQQPAPRRGEVLLADIGAQRDGVEGPVAQAALQQPWPPQGQAGAEVPYSHLHVRPAAAGHDGPVAREGNHRGRPGVGLQPRQQRPGAGVPEEHLPASVHRADALGERPGPRHLSGAGRERRLLDGQPGLGGDGARLAAGGELEQRDGRRPVLEAVAASDAPAEPRAVQGAPLHVARDAGHLHLRELLARGHVPQDDHAVRRAGEHEGAVRAHGAGPHGSAVAFEGPQVLPVGHAPRQDQLVLAASEQDLAHGVERHERDRPRVFLQHRVLPALGPSRLLLLLRHLRRRRLLGRLRL